MADCRENVQINGTTNKNTACKINIHTYIRSNQCLHLKQSTFAAPTKSHQEIYINEAFTDSIRRKRRQLPELKAAGERGISLG